MKKQYHELTAIADSSFVVKQHLLPFFNVPLHFHHAFELIYIVKSYGKFYAENRIMNFSEGDCYLFGPGFAHCFYNEQSFIDSEEMAHSIVAQFTEDFMGTTFFNLPELRKIKKVLSLSEAGIQIKEPSVQICNLFKELIGTKGMHRLLVLMQLLHEIANHPSEKIMAIVDVYQKKSLNLRDSEKMEAVVKYVMSEFREDLNVKKAASLACLNEAAFCRYFKRRTKKTFSQFVNDVRITHATRLLQDNDWSVTQICYECGYNNISYFNRQFKNIIGQTPLEYKRDMAFAYA
jgi:YesN/AraC family two-component response regulator